MTIKTKTIILSLIKYNDNDAIIKAFSYETGFTAYYIKGLLKNNKGKLKKAFFQPGNLLNIVASNKNKGHLEYIKEAAPYYHYKTINLDFDKLSMSIFLIEILIESLKNEQADKALYQFIEKQLIQLDQTTFNPDIHIIFMVQLSRYLGFEAQINGQGRYFDLENSILMDTIPEGQFLDIDETILFKRILGMIFDTKNRRSLKYFERKKGLEIMLKYYQLHIAHFIIPKSLKILGQVYK